MVQSISISDLTLRQVKQQFGLAQVSDSAIAEWQPPFPELTLLEQQVLARVQTNYAYLAERSLAEGFVNMVVVSPLLDLAGFYQPPFDVDIEFDISIPIQVATDDQTLVRGRIDRLVLNDQLFIATIESKRMQFDVMEALPQALAYMMGCPTGDRPLFGLATNGREFLFVQLHLGEIPSYSLSPIFSLTSSNPELHTVLTVLKRISANFLL
jgi:hypothetical protein